MYVGVGGAEEHGEACDGEEGDINICETAFARVVGVPADEDGEEGCGGVRGNAEEIGESGASGFDEAAFADDGGEEETEGVQGHVAAHVDDAIGPSFPVAEGLPEVFELEFFLLCCPAPLWVVGA